MSCCDSVTLVRGAGLIKYSLFFARAANPQYTTEEPKLVPTHLRASDLLLSVAIAATEFALVHCTPILLPRRRAYFWR